VKIAHRNRGGGSVRVVRLARLFEVFARFIEEFGGALGGAGWLRAGIALKRRAGGQEISFDPSPIGRISVGRSPARPRAQARVASVGLGAARREPLRRIARADTTAKGKTEDRNDS